MSWFVKKCFGPTCNDPIDELGFERINSIINDLNNWRTSKRNVNPNDLVFLKPRGGGPFEILWSLIELGTYQEILQRPRGRFNSHLIDSDGVDLGDISLPELRNNLYIIDRINPLLISPYSYKQRESDRLYEINLIRQRESLIRQQESDRREQLKIIKPSSKYEQLDTYDFGSVRQENSFNQNFVEMETQNPNTSMILCLMMHGGFKPNPQNQLIHSNFLLNKFSIAAAGQCGLSSLDQNRYVAYAMCDTVKKGGIIDVPIILREGFAHEYMTNDPNKLLNPTNVFARTITNLDQIYESELARIGSNVHHTGKVGETNTKGNEFFEKVYALDNYDTRHGLILCKDWIEIGGVAMDNLLANSHFISFMNEKYEPTADWSDQRLYTRIKRDFCGKIGQIYNMVSDEYERLSDELDYEADKRLYCIKRFRSSDLFSFCIMYGRTNLSLVDKSCSVFADGNPDQEYNRLSLFPGSAKGTRKGKKGTRKGTRKGKKGKIKGSQMVKSRQKYNWRKVGNV